MIKTEDIKKTLELLFEAANNERKKSKPYQDMFKNENKVGDWINREDIDEPKEGTLTEFIWLRCQMDKHDTVEILEAIWKEIEKLYKETYSCELCEKNLIDKLKQLFLGKESK